MIMILMIDCVGLNLVGVILILAFMVDPPRGDAEHHQVTSGHLKFLFLFLMSYLT